MQFQDFYTLANKIGIDTLVAFVLSIPISFSIFMIFRKRNLLVDLGFHTWIIKR